MLPTGLFTVVSTVLATVLLSVLLSGCSLFDRGDDTTASTPVTEVQVGQCLAAPTKEEALISEVEAVPCDTPHGQEAYDSITFEAADPGQSDDLYPGEDALTEFADGACAGAFGTYVGIDYLDSTYFFTYLLPSPRSWESGDHDVLCLATSSQGPLTGSLKGAGK